jgi:hypothetical protein
VLPFDPLREFRGDAVVGLSHISPSYNAPPSAITANGRGERMIARRT